MFSIKNIIVCLAVVLGMSASSLLASDSLLEVATRNASVKFARMVMKVGLTNDIETIREQVLPGMISREMDDLMSEAKLSWANYVKSPEYRFGIKSVEMSKNDIRFYHISHQFHFYRNDMIGYVRVNGGIPFALPTQAEVLANSLNAREARIEYLRIYANRYAQSYNLGLRGDELSRRLPFYDRNMKPNYRPYY